MSGGNGLKSIIYDLLPDEPPGITYEQIMEALEAIGISRDYRTLQKTIHYLRSGNHVRCDGRAPKRLWRGPEVAEPKPYYRAEPRPAWTRPGPELLRECHAAREEIRQAMKR
jgi:hypothetical protein